VAAHNGKRAKHDGKCRDAKAHYESGRALCELVGQRVRAAPNRVGLHAGLGLVLLALHLHLVGRRVDLGLVLHLARLRGGVELVVGLGRAVARQVAAGVQDFGRDGKPIRLGALAVALVGPLGLVLNELGRAAAAER